MKPSKHAVIWLSIMVVASVFGFLFFYRDSDWLTTTQKIGIASEGGLIFGVIGALFATGVVIALVFKEAVLEMRMPPAELVRWCSCIGTAIGAVLTTLVQVIMMVCDTGDTTIGWLMLGPCMLAYAPAGFVAMSVGWKLSSERGIASRSTFLLMLLCNSALLALAGAALASGAATLRSAFRKNGNART